MYYTELEAKKKADVKTPSDKAYKREFLEIEKLMEQKSYGEAMKELNLIIEKAKGEGNNEIAEKAEKKLTVCRKFEVLRNLTANLNQGKKLVQIGNYEEAWTVLTGVVNAGTHFKLDKIVLEANKLLEICDEHLD